MKWLWCLLLVAIWCSSAFAQVVPVRSGEHEGFSRLVLDLPSRVAWVLEDMADGRILRIDRKGLRYDTSTVFQRITSDRLANVEQAVGDSGLNLKLACLCDVDVFWHGVSMLVVDIRDHPKDRPTKAITLVPAGANPVAVDLAISQFSKGKTTNTGSVSTDRPSDQIDDTTQATAYIATARVELARQIARAASMGLLVARDRHEPMENERLRVATESLDQQSANIGLDILNSPDTVADTSIALRAENSADLKSKWNSQIAHETSDGSLCLSSDLLNVPDWGADRSFSSQVGPSRSRLTQELDQLQETEALRLARLYIFFGFGAEAKQLLLHYHPDTKEQKAALALATILEDGHAVGSVLLGQTDCNSNAALWSVLAFETLPKNLQLNDDAILRSINELPRHLRVFLAPQLAQKLLMANHDDTAKHVLRMLERSPEKPSATQALAVAQSEISMGDLVGADTSLEHVVAANGGSTAEALVKRIDTRLQNGQAIPQNMAELAGAFALEHRDTAMGRDVARAYLEATAASGDFDNAFAEMGRLAPDLTPPIHDRVLSTVLGLLTQNADDITFLKHATDHKDVSANRIAAATANGVSRRFLQLGFPSLADLYVKGAVVGLDLNNRRLLRAEIALAQGRPRQAQVDVLGLTDNGANVLRARAASMVGSHRASHFLYLAAGHQNEALREALMAEDWKQVEATGGGSISQVAKSASAPKEDADSSVGVLARNRKVLQDSADTRNAVSKMLAAQAVPIGYDEVNFERSNEN